VISTADECETRHADPIDRGGVDPLEPPYIPRRSPLDVVVRFFLFGRLIPLSAARIPSCLADLSS
jgi:hypothetical protein